MPSDNHESFSFLFYSSRINSGSPAFTIAPGATSTLSTVPAFGTRNHHFHLHRLENKSGRAFRRRRPLRLTSTFHTLPIIGDSTNSQPSGNSISSLAVTVSSTSTTFSPPPPSACARPKTPASGACGIPRWIPIRLPRNFRYCAELESLHLDLRDELAGQDFPPEFQQFLRGNLLPFQPIEKAQQPGLRENFGLSILVPDRRRATHELVTTWPLHSVNAEIRTTDAHRVFRRPCPRRIVFRRDEPVPRIERCRNWRPRYTSPSPITRYSVVKTISFTCSMESSPLIRRMNSMLLGHHGASARTPFM